MGSGLQVFLWRVRTVPKLIVAMATQSTYAL